MSALAEGDRVPRLGLSRHPRRLMGTDDAVCDRHGQSLSVPVGCIQNHAACLDGAQQSAIHYWCVFVG